VVLLGAEQEAHGRIVSLGHHVLAIPAHVGVELAQVLVGEPVHLELDQDMALEDAVIEDQIDEAAGLADDDALLPSFEAEAVAELHQERVEVVEERVFEVGFADSVLRPEAEELEDVGIADRELGLGLFGRRVGQPGELGLVGGERRALEVERGDLLLERPHRPVAADALDLVESAFERVFEGDQLDEVREGEPLYQRPRIHPQPGNRRFPNPRRSGGALRGSRQGSRPGFGNQRFPDGRIDVEQLAPQAEGMRCGEGAGRRCRDPARDPSAGREGGAAHWRTTVVVPPQVTTYGAAIELRC
jgi:hypothetical protein